MKELIKLYRRIYKNWQQWWFEYVFEAEICLSMGFNVFLSLLLGFH